MTIGEMLEVAPNMCQPICICNDADGDNLKYGNYNGIVDDVESWEPYEEVQYEEVTDWFSTKDGKVYICYCNEKQKEDFKEEE